MASVDRLQIESKYLNQSDIKGRFEDIPEIYDILKAYASGRLHIPLAYLASAKVSQERNVLDYVDRTE